MINIRLPTQAHNQFKPAADETQTDHCACFLLDLSLFFTGSSPFLHLCKFICPYCLYVFAPMGESKGLSIKKFCRINKASRFYTAFRNSCFCVFHASHMNCRYSLHLQDSIQGCQLRWSKSKLFKSALLPFILIFNHWIWKMYELMKPARIRNRMPSKTKNKLHSFQYHWDN